MPDRTHLRAATSLGSGVMSACLHVCVDKGEKTGSSWQERMMEFATGDPLNPSAE